MCNRKCGLQRSQIKTKSLRNPIKEGNKHWNNTRYMFQLYSTLEEYLQLKGAILAPIFTLEQIMNCLKKIILTEILFDRRNVKVVICDKDMEKAFNMKAFHVKEIVGLVMKQLVLAEITERFEKDGKSSEYSQRNVKSTLEITRELRQVFLTVPHFPTKRKVSRKRNWCIF